jgi:hypothetical protein
MELIITISATFFSILGALTLFFEVSDRVIGRKKRGKIDTKRRSIVILLISMSVAGVWGIASRMLMARKKQAISLLTEIETRLFQIESLVNASMYSSRAGASKAVLSQLATDTYSYRLRLSTPFDSGGNDENTEAILYGKTLEPLEPDHQKEIERVLDQVRKSVDRSYVNADSPNYLELLRVIEQAKTTIRNYIHEYRK